MPRCYICGQNIGAYFKCSGEGCTTPFHATCASRARIYFNLSSTHNGQLDYARGAPIAYCDDHTPLKWENKVDVSSRNARTPSNHPEQVLYSSPLHPTRFHTDGIDPAPTNTDSTVCPPISSSALEARLEKSKTGIEDSLTNTRRLESDVARGDRQCSLVL